MTDVRTRREAKAAADMEWMEAILRGSLGNSATHVEWRTQVQAIRGWSRATFKRRLREFKARHPELEGGEWRGDPYWLPIEATGAMAMIERMAGLTPGRFAYLASLQRTSLEVPKGSLGLREQALRQLKG
jgi:hypothetical protein